MNPEKNNSIETGAKEKLKSPMRERIGL